MITALITITTIQFFINVGIIHYFLKISGLKITSKIWWVLLAGAFFLTLFTRIYNYITVRQIAELEFWSISFFVKIVLPFFANVLILGALWGMYNDFKRLYSKWL